jgi:hypothetical protein
MTPTTPITISVQWQQIERAWIRHYICSKCKNLKKLLKGECDSYVEEVRCNPDTETSDLKIAFSCRDKNKITFDGYQTFQFIRIPKDEIEAMRKKLGI